MQSSMTARLSSSKIIAWLVYTFVFKSISCVICSSLIEKLTFGMPVITFLLIFHPLISLFGFISSSCLTSKLPCVVLVTFKVTTMSRVPVTTAQPAHMFTTRTSQMNASTIFPHLFTAVNTWFHIYLGPGNGFWSKSSSRSFEIPHLFTGYRSMWCLFTTPTP